MAISPWCAHACWHINRLKLHLIGAFLLTPESVARVLSQVVTDASNQSFPRELVDSLRQAVPHPPVRSADGAIILNPYSDEKIAAIPFEQRYDFEAISQNQRFYASILFVLQTCVACETFLKTKLEWIIAKRPELLEAVQADIRPSIGMVVSASDLDDLHSAIRERAVSQTVKGKRWKDKLRRFCKFLGIALPADAVTDHIDQMFVLRNSLMHTKEPNLVDLTFIDAALTIYPDSDWSLYHVALPRLLIFADDVKESLYEIDQNASRVHHWRSHKTDAGDA